MKINPATVTTEDLRADIQRDADEIWTFYARAEFTKRTGTDWRLYAPINPRHTIQGVTWNDFNDDCPYEAAS